MIRHPLIKILVASVFLLLLTAGCVANPPRRDISDLEWMPQQPSAYLDPASADQPLLAPPQQAAQAAEFLKKYFTPWHTEAPLESTSSPFWAIDWIGRQEVYGANLRPVAPQRLQALIAMAAPENYPSLNRCAISVHRIDLRALPTHSPIFNDPRQAGEGFPFDNLQHSVLPANTPLLVTHLSGDGSWAFVETVLAYGWIPLNDLAWVDADFARDFETGNFLAFSRDGLAVFDSAGIYRFKAEIGGLLPATGKAAGGHRVLLADADPARQALLLEATIPFDAGEIFPRPLTSRRIAGLADHLMGQIYGWGGSFGGRDCSATMRDLFVPFGLWLPRNSSEQAGAGVVVPLAGLTPSKREQRLLAEGIPFLTLVRVPGHIMLYIGAKEGQSALLHTIWGLRTRSLTGQEGRWGIGRTVVTTLQPGLQRDGLLLGISNLRSKVESMNFLIPADRSSGPDEESHSASDR